MVLALQSQRPLLTILVAFLGLASVRPALVQAAAVASGQDDDLAHDFSLRNVYAGLSPEAIFGSASGLLRRDGNCATDFHSCLDINSTLCCANTKYCIIDPTNLEPACCAIGSLCGSPCSASQYQCNATTTITQQVTDSQTTRTTTSVSTYAACCPRRCQSTSMFACASSLSGGCCSYGQTCGTNQCIWTSTSTSSSAASSTGDASLSTLVAPTTCAASQSACTSFGTTGCCGQGYTCTAVIASASATATATATSQLLCALETATEVPADSSGHKLSGGASAGIGIGVVIGAAALIAFPTWVCVHKRRQRRLSMTTSSREMESNRHSQGGGSGGHSGSGRNPTLQGTASPSLWRPWNRSPSSSGNPAGSPAMSPPAVHGPYTDQQGAVNVPALSSSGVPIAPQGPHDIVAPVEIDSRAVDNAPGISPGTNSGSHSVTSPGTRGPAAQSYFGINPAAPLVEAASDSISPPLDSAAATPYYLDPNDEKSHLERLSYGVAPQPQQPLMTDRSTAAGHAELDSTELPPAPSYLREPPPSGSTNVSIPRDDDSPILPSDHMEDTRNTPGGSSSRRPPM